MRSFFLYLLAAYGALVLLQRIVVGYRFRRERERIESDSRRIRRQVRAAYNKGISGEYGFESGEREIALDEWAHIAYEEECWERRDLTTFDDSDDLSEEPSFEDWKERVVRHQEKEKWRAYFAKKERQWGQSVAEREALALQKYESDPVVVAALIAEWDRAVRRPSYARADLDLELEELAAQTLALRGRDRY